MDISLLHAGLAAGATLAALPVILHLFMKQTPKRVVFPALQLIRERQKRSHKKLKVKNWLLLLARMALVALMAFALSRPRLFSQTSLGDQEVPTAMALIFDTSLSMGYKDKDKTRLDEAKERAGEILKKTPDASLIFVFDSADAGAQVGLSPASARKRIEGLSLRAANRPLNDAMGRAYAAIVDVDRPRHEVYVLTDLARSSWDPGRTVEGLDLLKKAKQGVITYVLRLTPQEVENVAVVEAKPSASVATLGETVAIRATIRAQGPAVRRVVEFYLNDQKSGEQKRGEKSVDLPANGEVEVQFTTPKLDPSVSLHQGKVRLSGRPDNLQFDDERFFTFKVQPALKVVVVSDLAIDAEFVRNAIDPDPTTLPPGTPRPFRVEVARSSEFAAKALDLIKDASCIFLLDVAELDPGAWGRLAGYVRDGGGLVIGMGDRCLPEHYASTAVAQLAPATPVKKQNPAAPTSFGKINDANHPLFNRFPKELDEVLSQVPVARHWSVTPHQNSRTLLSFADNAPALLERTIRGPKSGHVLLWATPLARRYDRESPAAWNEFPQLWGFYYLMNQTVSYLAGSSDAQMIYEAGQDVLLPIDPTRRFKNYIVQGPDPSTTDRQSPPTSNDSLLIVAPQPVGQWSVTASGEDGARSIQGFSVNPPLSESQFVPLVKRDLDALFGPAKYALADDPQSLERVTQLARIGHEIFPWLMALILFLVTAESLLANRFYREAPTRSAEAPTRQTVGVST